MEATKIEHREQPSGFNRASSILIWQVLEGTQWQEAGIEIINDNSNTTRSQLLHAISAEYRLRTLRQGHDQQAIIASSVIDALAEHDSRESICRVLGMEEALTAQYIFSGIAEGVARKLRPVFIGRTMASRVLKPGDIINRLYASYRGAIERREFPEDSLNNLLTRTAEPFTRKTAAAKLLLQHASDDLDAPHHYLPISPLEKILTGLSGKYYAWNETRNNHPSEAGHFLLAKMLGNPQQELPLTYKGAVAVFWETYGEEAKQYSAQDLRQALTGEVQEFWEKSISLIGVPRPRKAAAEQPVVPDAPERPRTKTETKKHDWLNEEYWPDEPISDDEPDDDPFAATEVLTATRLGQDLTGDYLRTAGRFAVLTAEEEVTLAKTIEAGVFAENLLSSGELASATEDELREIARLGEAAREKMINHNLRLVVAVTTKYFKGGGHMALIDAIQEGNNGLLTAVERFDYAKGNKFSTYATWWIRQAVTRAVIKQDSTIRLTTTMHNRISLIRRIQDDFRKEFGRDPSIDEVAAEAKMTSGEVVFHLKAKQELVSLDAQIHGDSEDLALMDSIKDDKAADPQEALEKELQKTEFDRILAMLGPDDEELARLFFGVDTGKPLSIHEAAELLGTNPTKISTRIRRIRAKLRHPVIRSHFPEALAFLNESKPAKSKPDENGGQGDQAATL